MRVLIIIPAVGTKPIKNSFSAQNAGRSMRMRLRASGAIDSLAFPPVFVAPVELLVESTSCIVVRNGFQAQE